MRESGRGRCGCGRRGEWCRGRRGRGGTGSRAARRRRRERRWRRSDAGCAPGDSLASWASRPTRANTSAWVRRLPVLAAKSDLSPQGLRPSMVTRRFRSQASSLSALVSLRSPPAGTSCRLRLKVFPPEPAHVPPCRAVDSTSCRPPARALRSGQQAALQMCVLKS